MPLHHPVYGNPAVILHNILGNSRFNPRTRGELKADLLDRPLFKAQEMIFASSHKKIVITAEIDDFGSTNHRAISLTLDVNIQSGIYLFKRGEAGPIRDMSYTECVKKDGVDAYQLIQADVGTLHLTVIESCYSAHLFTFEGTDPSKKDEDDPSKQAPFEMCGDFKIMPPHATFSS